LKKTFLYKDIKDIEILRNAWEAVKDLHHVQYLLTDITPQTFRVRNGTEIVLCRFEKCRNFEEI